MTFKAGNEVRVANMSKDLVGICPIDEMLPVDFSIYNVPQFIQSVAIFEDPTIKFDESAAMIQQGQDSVIYNYTDEDNVQSVPYDFNIPLPAEFVPFGIEQLQKLRKSVAALKLDELTITCRDGLVNAALVDEDNPNSHAFNMQLAENSELEDFEIMMPLSKLLLIINTDYNLYVTDNCLIFVGIEFNLVYYVTFAA